MSFTSFSIIIKNNAIILKGHHSHESRPAETLVKKVKAKMQNLIINSSQAHPQIYEKTRQEFAVEGGVEFVSKFVNDQSFRNLFFKILFGNFFKHCCL